MKFSSLDLKNQFACLYEESTVHDDDDKEYNVDNLHGMLMIGKRNIFKLRSRRPKHVQHELDASSKLIESGKRVVITKINHRRDYLKRFETANKFDVLRGNGESDLDKILKVNKILITPKHSLKKCRRCNFKKRTCIIDPGSCKASQFFCFRCNKFGHFPKSIFCKTRNKYKKNKVSKKYCYTNYEQSKQWKEDVYLLVMKRIHQLERLSEMQEIRKNEDKSFQQLIQAECSDLSNQETLSMKKCKNMGMRKEIVRKAKYCAKRFGKETHQLNNWKFVHYCSKKINNLLFNKKMDYTSFAAIQGIFSAFDKVFYQSQMDENQDKFPYDCFPEEMDPIQRSDSIYESQASEIPNKSFHHKTPVKICKNIEAYSAIKLRGGGDPVDKQIANKKEAG